MITRSMSAVLSLLCVLLSSESASAQTRLFVTLAGQGVCNDCQTEYALEIDVDTPRIVDQSVIHDANSVLSSTVTADGRFLVWIGLDGGGVEPLGPLTLSVLDTATNSVVIRARPQAPLIPNAVYAHPGRTRIFVSTGASIVAMEPDRQQTFPLDPGCPNARLTGVSPNGERLVVSCTIGFGFPGETRVLHSETGAQLSTMADAPPLQALNAEGTELFTIQSAPSALLTRRDATTGAVLAQRDITAIAESAFEISVDPLTGRVFLVGTIPPPAGANHLTIFEAADLSLVTQFIVPHHGGLLPQILKPAFSDDGRAFFRAAIPIGNQLGTRLSVFDTVNAVPVTTVDLPTRGTPSGITVASRPRAPTDVMSTVAGQSVTLQWKAGPGPAPSAYVLNVGLSSGATDLTIDVPSAASEYVVGGVPSGTYYVRVRSKNAGGALSVPSEEVQVVVP
jgi:hypothetical protein